jgi:hypothetical protein
VCLENVMTPLLENLTQTFFDDLKVLCCLIKNCDNTKYNMCKLSNVSAFITELINLNNKQNCDLNNDLIGMFLTKKPSKCIDYRLLSVYMYDTFFQHSKEQQ